MSEPYLGMIIIVPYNFAPRGWAFCNGQILPIAQNTALFSLLGTTFGGNGQTTFALPDLRGRVPNSSGQGPGLSSYDLGQVGGSESVTLLGNEIPAHTHTVACAGAGTSSKAANNLPANLSIDPVPNSGNVYSNAAPTATMAPTMIPLSGGGNQPHANIQPYLTLNYCIALEGIFPSRN